MKDRLDGAGERRPGRRGLSVRRGAAAAGTAESRYPRVPVWCEPCPSGLPRGMTPRPAAAGPPRAPPRCSAPLRRAPRRDRGLEPGPDGMGGGVSVSSRRLSPDGQRKPLAERAASPSQCAHLAERRERGGRIAAFLGEVPAPRPSPAPPHPPPPPGQQRRSADPPLLRLSSCAALPCPTLSPTPHDSVASPFPTAKQRVPINEADRRLGSGS
ncbi:uncharacterized protein LOC134159322 [Pezoporus occidentalis]|uniref:uncharacterized protein LOC134159322 n=1 Tax=Pezoporus occidentalis TaxID=407982 RepID=UPI002F90C1D5